MKNENRKEKENKLSPPTFIFDNILGMPPSVVI